MDKQERPKGIALKSEIRKQKVPHYPYYNFTTTYSHDQDYFFVISFEYLHDTIILNIYPFSKDMSKLSQNGITVKNIFEKKAISVIHFIYLKYRPSPTGVTIFQAEFVLGCRSGQLALIEYNGKECKIMAKFNKTLKNQGLLSKTSSFFFGDEDSYSVYFKEAIKGFKVVPWKTDLKYCYQVGNHLVFMKNLIESSEKLLFEAFEINTAEYFSFHYDLNMPAEKGVLNMYGCDSYYAIKDQNKKTGLIKFNHEISSYEFLSQNRNEVAVSLSVKQTILLIDLYKFVLKRRIITEISIRNLYFFAFKQEEYLAIMVYDNYILLYELNFQRFCKLYGHRSFISNIAFNPKQEIIFTGGMDHRISLIKLTSIKQNKWSKAIVDDKTVELDENSCEPMRFTDIFSQGQYNNVRTNLHSYGFANILALNDHYCLPTYDNKIMIYKYV